MTTPSPANLTWAEATSRAQQRISDLAARRQAEAQTASLADVFTKPSSSSRTAFRVGQLDTELLDAELLDLLKNQVWSGLKYFNPTLKETYEAEFVGLLRLALFKLTIWDHDATYGAALQNLAYADARHHGAADVPPSITQKSMYGLITVLGRYGWDKLQSHLLSNSSYDDESTPFARRLSAIMDRISTLHSVASFFSLLTFVANGRYRTLLDRVLRMRLVTPTRHISREVSFEYLNRQLVWHAFTEFLLFILPIVGVGRWRRWLSRLWKKSVLLIRRSRGVDDEEDVGVTGVLGFLPERTCAICYQESTVDDIANPGAATSGAISANDITNPYEAVECGHVYCYVCIASKIELEEGEGWTCLRCGKTCRRCRPWRAGVVGLTNLKGVNFDEGHVSDEETARSPKEDHGMEDILDSVEEEEEDDDDEAPLNEDPINEDPINVSAEPIFAGGDASGEEDEDAEDSDGTERADGHAVNGVYGQEETEDESYDTADDWEEANRGRR